MAGCRPHGAALAAVLYRPPLVPTTAGQHLLASSVDSLLGLRFGRQVCDPHLVHTATVARTQRRALHGARVAPASNRHRYHCDPLSFGVGLSYWAGALPGGWGAESGFHLPR